MARRTQTRKAARSKPELEANTTKQLVTAAMAEFNVRGFGGTDSNRIARRAGFAPQTFYRWFADKTAIFLAAYQAWEAEEMAALAHRGVGTASLDKLARVIVKHHRNYRLFRRSLRLLSVEEPRVRRARAESRQRQVALIQRWLGGKAARDADALLLLLQIERLSDAIAEEELADLGVREAKAIKVLAELLGRFRPLE
jgi:AcrR family transcriptional regulator